MADNFLAVNTSADTNKRDINRQMSYSATALPLKLLGSYILKSNCKKCPGRALYDIFSLTVSSRLPMCLNRIFKIVARKHWLTTTKAAVKGNKKLITKDVKNRKTVLQVTRASTH